MVENIVVKEEIAHHHAFKIYKSVLIRQMDMCKKVKSICFDAGDTYASSQYSVHCLSFQMILFVYMYITEFMPVC